jgi:uncharacterized protein (UPF0332 family)
MDATGFIALAGKLAAAPAADEATYRTAVSRAYYGAFHVARLFLVELGFRPVGNANVHAFVRHYLASSNDADACLAASQLADLQAARNRADYDLANADVGTRNFAMVIVELAHRVVSAIEKCRRGDVIDAIRQAIADYERRIHTR